jgi:hypothetical protein
MLRCDSNRRTFSHGDSPYKAQVWHKNAIFIGGPMTKSKNPFKSEDVTLALIPQTLWYLDRLVELGLYGNNRAEAAKILVLDHCKLLIGQNKLQEINPMDAAQIASISPDTVK